MRSAKKKLEKAEDSFKFEVGATYENMKGAYAVMSVKNDSMIIRWEDGKEAITSVELQMRIIERMAYEKKILQQEEAKSQVKDSKKTKRKQTPASTAD
jgi:hypothetical protein